MQTRIRKFIRRLRARGLDISPGEHLDALAALQQVQWLDRAAFREALRATLVKRNELAEVFDEEFARYFAPAPLERPEGKHPGPGRGGKAARERRSQSGATQQEGGRRQEAEESDGRRSDASPQKAEEPTKVGERGPGSGGDTADEQASAGGPARFRVPAPIGAERTVRELWRSPTRGMSAAELRELRRHVRLMARRLATVASRRSTPARRGEVEMKGTIRKALQFGGVPFVLARKRPKVREPELVVLCDVSGSVVRMSELTLELLRGLSASARRTRVFAYTNRAVEVTAALREGEGDLARAAEALGLNLHAFSDFGGACYDLVSRQPALVGPKASVIVIGDGRNNHGEAMAWAFEDLVHNAHRVIWLVPEPKERWNTADSQLDAYRPSCHIMAECDTVEKLLRALRRRW